MDKKEIKQLRMLSKIIFFLGVALFLIIKISEIVRFGNLMIEINVYEKLFASLLVYSSITFYLLSKETRPFKKSIKYLKSSFIYIYFVILLFTISAVAGFTLSNQLSFLEETLRKIVIRTTYLNSYELMAFILINNSIASLMGIILGMLFGIFPALSSIGNGVIIGFVMSKVGLGSFWRLIPHGIFELPAVFISFGIGIKLGFSIFSKNRAKTIRERLHNSLLVFSFIVIPLLVIAAIIEGLLIRFLP